MSFSVTIGRSESEVDFEEAVIAAVPQPKADGRTKEGKRQKVLEQAAKEALSELAYGFREHEGGFGGSISGHAGADGTGFVSLSFNLLGPAPE